MMGLDAFDSLGVSDKRSRAAKGLEDGSAARSQGSDGLPDTAMCLLPS